MPSVEILSCRSEVNKTEPKIEAPRTVLGRTGNTKNVFDELRLERAGEQVKAAIGENE